jgi:hypothetical protein
MDKRFRWNEKRETTEYRIKAEIPIYWDRTPNTWSLGGEKGEMSNRE